MSDWRPRVEAMIGQPSAPPPAPEVDDWVTPAEPMAAAPQVDDWFTPDEPTWKPQGVPDAPGRVLQSAIEGGIEGFRQGGAVNLSPEEQQRAVDEYGPVIGYPLATLGAGIDLASRAGNALFRGAQAGVQQAFGEVGMPQLGRDVAALPEAFPTAGLAGIRAAPAVRPMFPRGEAPAPAFGGTGGPVAPVAPRGPGPSVAPRPAEPVAPRPGGPSLNEQLGLGTPDAQSPAAPRPVETITALEPTPDGKLTQTQTQVQVPEPPIVPPTPPVSPLAALDAVIAETERKAKYPNVPDGDMAAAVERAIQETMKQSPPGSPGVTPQTFMEKVRQAFEGLMVPITRAADLGKRKESLGAFMADPRPNEEIAAEMAAQQTGAIDTARAGLPPGFQIQEANGEWTLTDPAGDAVGTLSQAPTQAELDQWTKAANDLSQDVDWSDYLRDGEGTQAAPVNVVQPNDIEAAAAQVATPTPDQADAGNYRKGHIKLHGLDIAIENPAGSERHGIDPSGAPWTTVMPADYGYVKRSKGADGDQVDVYLGPSAHEANKHQVWVVDQIDPATGQFDEHKAMLGYPSQGAAEAAYREGFSDGSGQSRIGAVSPMPWPQFIRWARRGNTTDPLAYRPPAVAPEPEAPIGAPDGEIIQVPPSEAPPLPLTPEPMAAPALASEPEAEPLDQLMVEAELLEMELAEQGKPGTADAWDQVQIPEVIEEAAPVPQEGQQDGGRTRPSSERDDGGEASQDAGEPPAEPATPGPSASAEPGDAPGEISGTPPVVAGPGDAPDAEPDERPEPEPDTGRDTAGSADSSGPIVPGDRGETGPSAETAEAAGEGVAGLADAFRDAFLAGRSFATIQQARAFATQVTGKRIDPGTMAAKETDEQIEAGVVAAARKIVEDMRGDPSGTYDRLVRLYGQQPNLSTRTSGSIARQAYSTPMPLAFAASELAGIGPDTGVVYEPTAGNGALLIGANPSSVLANELDPERRAALEAQGFRFVSGRDASGAIPKEYERIAGAVIANPPFGAVKGENGKTVRYDMDFIQPGYDTGEIDHAIALRSLEAMRDDGRAVLILGGINKLVKTPKGRADAYNGKAKREFFFTLYGKYNVVDHFTVPGELYAKQGAAWPVDVIVIEGRGKSARPLPAVTAPRIVPTWDAIKEAMTDGRAAGPAGGTTADEVADAGPGAGVGGDIEPVGVSGAAVDGRPATANDVGAVSGTSDAADSVDAGPGAGPQTGVEDAGSGDGAGGAATGGAVPGVEPGGGAAGDVPGERGVSEQPSSGGGSAAPAVAGQTDAGSRAGNQGDDAGGLDRPRDTVPASGAGVEPSKPRAATDTEKPQVAYETASKAGRPVGTLVPTNLSSATHGALDALVDRVSGKAGVKNVDDFVADKLGYSLAELSRYFSGEQIDAIALGIDQIDKGQGFIIGDQTGVGKGRVVAGMIRYAERAGLVPIFVTEKQTLFADMARDLRDIGMPDIVDKILSTNANLRLSLTEDPNGPKIRTADVKLHDEELRKVAREVNETGRLPDKYRVVMTTYNQLQTVRGAKTTRMQVVEALAPRSFLILDEAHNAGGAGANAEEMTTKAGKLILPRSIFFRQLVAAARSTFFSSATWAKRPDVMDLYGAKTGMRAAVDNLEQLAETIAKGGVPMQQIVTSQLSQMGQYIRRERSFDGVTYDLVPIEVDKKAYDDIAGILSGIFEVSVKYVKPAIKDISDSIREGAKGASGGMGVGDAGASTTSFGSVMHNLINQMLLASKAQGTVDRALEKLKEGKKPVITVANTMGSFIKEFAQENGAENGDMLDLNFNNLLKRYLRRTLRYIEKTPFTAGPGEEHWLEPEDLGSEGAALYHEIEAAIDALSLGNMPVSPIDYMRSKLIAAGYKVGEITGRTEAADYRADGRVYYRIRPGKELSPAGRTETIRGFNRGDLDVVILNQAGATGLSLHASEKFEDKRKRAMLIAQAENNIDTHMQMLGRVHRTGQVIAPEYEQLIANIPAEKRPAAVLAAKMASLNASTTSSRKAMIGAANTPDFINKYGGSVAASVVFGLEDWADVLKDAISDTEDTPDYEAIARKITGRIPLLPLARQEEVYGQIEDQYLKLIEDLDAAGENALEAKTLDLEAKVIRSQEFIAGKGDPSNPFSAPAMLELMDVKRTTKPPKPEFVVLDVARAMKVPGATIDRYQDLSFDGMATALDNISIDYGRDVTENLLQKLDARIADDQKKIRGMNDQEAAKKRQDRTLATQQRIGGFLRVAVPGTMITIQSGDEDAPMRAVVIDVGLKGKSPSASAPSNYELTVMAEDGIRRRIEGARLYTTDTMPQSANEQNQRVIAPIEDPHAAAEFLASMSDQSKRSREERWMITGNILAGYAQRSGQIVNFTDDKGAIKQGVLLARDFDPVKNLAGKAAEFTVDQAYRFLTAAPLDLPTVEGSVKGIRIARDSQGRFVIRAPSAKATGGVYYLDQNLLRAIGQEFVRSGPDMRATITADRLRAVLGEIQSILSRQSDRLISRHAQAVGWLEDDKPKFSQGAPTGWETGKGVPVPPGDPAVLRASVEAVQKVIGPAGRVTFAKGLLAGGRVGGLAAGGLMRMAAGDGDERTHWSLHHEAIHVLRNLGLFSPSEWKTLEAAVERYGWIDRFDLRTRYPNLSGEALTEEAIAEAFGQFATIGTGSAPPGGVAGRAWRKTQRFMDAFRNALEGRGLRTAEGMFERTQAGRIGARTEPRMEPKRKLSQSEEDRLADEYEAMLTLPTDDGDVSLMAGMSPELRKLVAAAGKRTKEATEAAVQRLWSGTPVPKGVKVADPVTQRDINSLTAPFKTPVLTFQNTEMAPVIAAGIRAEELQSRWITRLVTRYDAIRKALRDADGDFDKVTEALWAGDADQVDIDDDIARAELFDEWGLTDAEAKAFMEFHKLLEAQARLVDNHRRYMMPQVRAEKQRLIDQLERILDHARVPGREAGRLYRQRAVLTKRIASGKSKNPAADSATIQAINQQLRAMRSSDADIQARVDEIQNNIDGLEARLNASGVRGKIKGYVPHKFYGNWRLFVLGDEDPETGERGRTEITSDQGFYNTREEAIQAAADYKEKNPDADLLIEPKQIQWPVGIEGTITSDAAFGTLARNLAAKVGLQGAELNAVLTGVARRQNRRRLYTPGMHREGAEGFSREMDRVMRTHIGQSVRYVTMDKLKFQAITAMEKAGIGPYRLVTQERRALQKQFQSWLDDVMGRKQGFEETMDAALRRFPVPATVLMTGLMGATVGASIGLLGASGEASAVVSGLVGTYAGYQMYKTLTGKAVPWRAPEHYTDFPTRQFISHVTSGVAHLLLGMVFNIKSALVNLMQTPVNTYPEIGLKYTMRGMVRAERATWASMNGRHTADTRLMERAGVQTLYRINEAGPVLAEHESRLAKFSMWAFQSAENINRAVAFFGGYERAMDQGHSPRVAFEQGAKVMRDTQFHMGAANKPQILRQQWARMPGQFKNFVFQQAARVLSIPLPKVAKTTAMIAVLGGALALPGFQVIDAGVKLLTGWSPTNAIEQTVLEQQAVGGVPANAATAIARGLPAIFTDISQSVGMGVGFLPTSARDITGPFWSKIEQQQEASAKSAGLVDRLAALSPSFNALKALEAAANGQTIGSTGFIDALGDGRSAWTDWRRGGKTLYEPSNLQLLAQSFNFTPPGVTALRSGMRQGAITLQEYRRDRARYMADIIQAIRNKDIDAATRKMAEANGKGIQISVSQVSQAMKEADKPAMWRMLEDTPKALRPKFYPYLQGVENMGARVPR